MLLRCFAVADAAAVSDACADPEIGRFTFMETGLTPAGAAKWIEQAGELWALGTPRFAIVDAPTDRLLGQVGMAVDETHQSAEVFYWVVATERGRHVASTALALICDWAFACGIERVFLLVDPENEASHRVAARGGFTREGVLRGYEQIKGRRADLVSWSLLPDDPRPWRQDA